MVVVRSAATHPAKVYSRFQPRYIDCHQGFAEPTAPGAKKSMSRAARVTSIDAVRELREALSEFGKDAREHLAAADATLRRTSDWLNERLKHWQRELRVRQEEMSRAKSELYRREQMKKQGIAPGTAEQDKAFRIAQARAKEAEDKIKNCRRWQPQWQHAMNEYQGAIRSLQNALNLNLVHALNMLENKLAALEAYLATEPPARITLPATGVSHEPGHDAAGTGHGPEEGPPALGRNEDDLERPGEPTVRP